MNDIFLYIIGMTGIMAVVFIFDYIIRHSGVENE